MNKKLFTLTLTSMLSLSMIAKAESGGVSYFDMSLEELMDIEVTIASKSEEKSFSSSSAIYVLTSEDIQRSGATTIAEALKLVPGTFVSEFAGQSRVSVRGFNINLTDKLLVLMDGRTLYTPLFSGVYWDEVDTFFDDISRIEVVRGPGGTLWGANAVNGVINIITKNAKDTVGTNAYALAGDYDNFQSAIRKGVQTGEESFFRAYAKYYDRGPTNRQEDNDEYFDETKSGRIGFRFDANLTANETLKVQGDGFLNRLDFPYDFGTITNNTDETSGGNILAKWEKKEDKNNSISVQTYIDYTNHDFFTLGDEKFTYDLEIVKQRELNKHDFVIGAGYRYVMDDLDNTNLIAGNPERRETDIVNAFAQDKYAIYQDKVYVTVGSKFSHNDYTHFEYQPSIRLSILPNEDNTFWASVSKAVRTPNRKENDPEILFSYPATSNDQVESEDLVAYEFGYRTKAIKNFSFDLATYYNDYSNLSTQEENDAGIYFANNGSGYTYGYETSANWQVQDNWKLMANYSYIDMNLKDETGASLGYPKIKDNTPDNIFNIRSLTNIGKKWEWDNTYYYWSSLKTGDTGDGNVRDYNGFTSRLAYKPTAKQEISLVIRDAFDSTHNDAASAPTTDRTSETQRRFYVKYTQKF